MRFDVLVVGSGASGLAAAVSADGSGASVAVVAKGALQSCNSAKAQGGIQAAFGEDDSPEQHAEDVWQSSHETADRRLVEILTAEAPGAIHWLEELGVEFTRENGGYRLARCGGAIAQAAAPGRRPDRARDHERPARRGRGIRRSDLPQVAADRARADRARLAGALRRARDRRRDRRARRRRALLPRGAGARRALHEPPRRDRRGDEARARRSAPRAATSTRSSTTRTAAPGPRRCRATRFPRRRAPTAPCS